MEENDSSSDPLEKRLSVNQLDSNQSDSTNQSTTYNIQQVTRAYRPMSYVISYLIKGERK